MKVKKSSHTAALRRLQLYGIPLFVLAVISAAMGLKHDPLAFSILCGGTIILGAVTALLLFFQYRKLRSEFDSLVCQSSPSAKHVFCNLTQPAAICSEQGQVIMRNKLFEEITTDLYLNKIFTPEELTLTEHDFEKTIGDRHFMVSVSAMDRTMEHSRNLVFIMMTDITLQVKYYDLFEGTKPCVVKIFIDNYDNISLENDININTVLNKIEERILHLSNNVTMGIYRRETRSFLMIFESKYLTAFEEELPGLLRDMHSIHTAEEKDISLSIGVGADSNINTASMIASEALEMALGRGGDQAVVRRCKDAAPQYYGDGKNNADQSLSGAFVRNLANRLRALILDSSEVYVMGHRDEDVDCVGAGLALVSTISAKLGKPAYFVYEGGLDKLVDSISTMPPDTLKPLIISTRDVPDSPKNGALLIIVDTQREMMLSYPDLYKQLCDNTVVIDHHRRSADNIKNTLMSIMESTVSSASEMVTQLIRYMSDSQKPIPRFEATALFAGISMDTKGFIYNTTKSTFEAAALLRKCGADTTGALTMYQDDKKRYEEISGLVSQAVIYYNKVAVSVCDRQLDDARAIIARAADTLVSLKGISASFVIIQTGDDVTISARSTGGINVQIICERLGGGGHRTVAGAQLRSTNCENALELLMAELNTYFSDKEKKSNESNSTD